MSSTEYSLKPIDKVSSDNLNVGFDLLSNLTYMSVLSLGSLPRDQVLAACARQQFKTAVFFDFIYVMAKRVGMEYTRAFQLAAEKARAEAALACYETYREVVEQHQPLRHVADGIHFSFFREHHPLPLDDVFEALAVLKG